jgi:hypothetical protein
METKKLIEEIKEQILLIEEDIDKTTASAKGRCRSNTKNLLIKLQIK